ncbi:hypothetical protein APHAL10511_005797 [Amanita phalloides]|nr:hypothetical protein APHAL10511_005797 [Amanita phalloides]
MAFDLAITVPLKQEEKYPLVMFWLHNKYKKQKRSTGPCYCFLQNSDSEEITEAWLNKIHAFLLGMFNELKELLTDNSALPQTWFTLCSGDWKARSFMIEWYPNWARNHLDSDGEDDIEITSTIPVKRAMTSESSKKSIKKIKVKEEPRVKIPEIHDPLASMDTNTPANNQVATSVSSNVNNGIPTSVSNKLNQLACSMVFNTNTMPPSSLNASQFNVPLTALSTSNTIPTVPSLPNSGLALNTPTNNFINLTPNLQTAVPTIPMPSATPTTTTGPSTLLPSTPMLNRLLVLLRVLSNPHLPLPTTCKSQAHWMLTPPWDLDLEFRWTFHIYSTTSDSSSLIQPSATNEASGIALPNQEVNSVGEPSHPPSTQAQQTQIKLTGPPPPQQPSIENPAVKGAKKRGRKPMDVQIDPNTTNPKYILVSFCCSLCPLTILGRELYGLEWLLSLGPNAPHSMMALNAAWKALGENRKQPYKERSKGLIKGHKGKGNAVEEEGEAGEE